MNRLLREGKNTEVQNSLLSLGCKFERKADREKAVSIERQTSSVVVLWTANRAEISRRPINLLNLPPNCCRLATLSGPTCIYAYRCEMTAPKGRRTCPPFSRLSNIYSSLTIRLAKRNPKEKPPNHGPSDRAAQGKNWVRADCGRN